MAHELNALGQPVGVPVAGWAAPPWPPLEPMAGRLCRLEPLSVPRHAAELYAANGLDAEGRNWTYLPYGPFKTIEQYTSWMTTETGGSDPQLWAIVDALTAGPRASPPISGSIRRRDPQRMVNRSSAPAATEAMYLMMRRAFELGYRRYEWKCDALNAPSRAAAERLGFSYEGLFRQARVNKGRNRDTAWYAVIDRDWPSLREMFEQWLAPANFDERGQQRKPLRGFRAP